MVPENRTAVIGGFLRPIAFALGLLEYPVLSGARALSLTRQAKEPRYACSPYGTPMTGLFTYLKRFPVHRLKVDQSFVRGLTTDRDDAATVKAVIQLGHSLRLTVIAEGVEADEQLAALRDLGCDEAQGYLFCRPVPPDEFTAWVKARHQLRTLEPTTVPA